MKIGDLVT